MQGMSQPGAVNAPGVAATNRFPAGFVPNQQYLSHMPGRSQPGAVSTPGVAATNCFPAGFVPNQQYPSHMPGRSQPGAVSTPGVAATNRFPSVFVPKPMFQNVRRNFTPGFQQQHSGIIDATTHGQSFDLTRDDGGDVPPTWPTTPNVPVPSAPTKRKRQSGEEDEVPKVPKKRGRPPKAKPMDEVPKVPKKRGRPPKTRPVVVAQEPTPDTTTTTNSSLEEQFAFEATPFADFNEYTIDARVEAGTPCRLQERGQDSIEAVETVDNLPAFSFPAFSAAESIWADAPMVQEPWIMDVAPADDLPASFFPACPAVDSMLEDATLPQESEIVERGSFEELMDAFEARAAADDLAANAATDEFVCGWNDNLEDLIF
ncbi:uncharacterized protein J4E78_001388 [Alternaria triticimaculans]|uniref:uncharacterized protein n=1 Tax=Alternaria triticimaculans TaxID=297637 RepID=UPI0020C56702|nr:uncharacterized protein J4E78_001388 [Alternaria triticimaculans]KAI4672885.1 hypothetical protein J4E78_001388 [Alternaria triticimaculans]